MATSYLSMLSSLAEVAWARKRMPASSLALMSFSLRQIVIDMLLPVLRSTRTYAASNPSSFSAAGTTFSREVLVRHVSDYP